jgi:MOSC domain-containing protein YiiM
MNIPQTLSTAFGHMDTGIYATVQSGGTIKAGDTLIAS